MKFSSTKKGRFYFYNLISKLFNVKIIFNLIHKSNTLTNDYLKKNPFFFEDHPKKIIFAPPKKSLKYSFFFLFLNTKKKNP